MAAPQVFQDGPYANTRKLLAGFGIVEVPIWTLY
jgi:hypothetical protein